MKLPYLFMFLNCFLGSVAVDRNLTENHVTQDPTNKETFIPVPVNNDKFSKLSNSHKSHDDEKQSNNDNNSNISNNSSSSNINNDNNNVDTRQTVEKKSFKNIRPNRKVQNSVSENISPPKQQQLQQQQQLHSGNKNNYKVLDYPFQHDYETGRNPFRYAPTEEDYISKVIRSELDLVQPGRDDEVDYYNNNFNHNKRYNYNENNHHAQSKLYNNNNNNKDDDNNIDKYYSDYDQLDEDEYRAKYIKGRINSLAHLLGSKVGIEAHKRLSDRRNLVDNYLGRVVLPRASEQLVKSYYDDDDDHQIEDDDVMDSYDLARVMLKRSDNSYLDSYIDNAIRSGLLNPKLAENYRLNVMKEYEDMLSNHDDNENNDDDSDDGINGGGSNNVGGEDALPEISEDHRRQIDTEFSEHFPVRVPEFRENRMFDPPHHKVEKKFQLSGGHYFNDRQQELEEFASILRQVHLENELENMAKKHANQLIN